MHPCADLSRKFIFGNYWMRYRETAASWVWPPATLPLIWPSGVLSYGPGPRSFSASYYLKMETTGPGENLCFPAPADAGTIARIQ